MDRLNRAFDIFRQSLDNAHIPTITVDWPYHSDTEDLYTLAFDFYHLSKEIKQNIWEDDAVEVEDVAQETYDFAEELKELIDEEISENSNTWYDNLLRGLSERAVEVCWKMKRYQHKLEEEKETPEEEKQEDTEDYNPTPKRLI